MRLSRVALLACLSLALLAPRAHAQSAPKHYLSAASTNSTLVLNRPSLVKMINAVNTTATLYYLKLYNKATAPTCNTDVPVLTVPVPASATGGAPVQIPIPDGLLFPLGVGFCLTGGIADNDNTSAATGVAINLAVTGR
jgi:hypothetical protein